jgi:hypothetical protein
MRVPLQECPKSECRLTCVRMQWVHWTNCALWPLLAFSCGDAGLALFTLSGLREWTIGMKHRYGPTSNRKIPPFLQPIAVFVDMPAHIGNKRCLLLPLIPCWTLSHILLQIRQFTLYKIVIRLHKLESAIFNQLYSIFLWYKYFLIKRPFSLYLDVKVTDKIICFDCHIFIFTVAATCRYIS